MSSTKVCVDASFIVRLVTSNDPNSPYDSLWNQWQQSSCTVVAPTLIYYEISNALYRYKIAGQITQQESEQLLERALNLGLVIYGDAELHQQALEIARRQNLSTTYDAHYLALAERLGIEFWTVDLRLFNGVRSTLSWVNIVK